MRPEQIRQEFDGNGGKHDAGSKMLKRAADLITRVDPSSSYAGDDEDRSRNESKQLDMPDQRNARRHQHQLASDVGETVSKQMIDRAFYHPIEHQLPNAARLNEARLAQQFQLMTCHGLGSTNNLS